MALSYVSTQIWDFSNISYFPNIVSIKLFGSSCTRFILLKIKFLFTCGESDLYYNIVKFQNTMTRIIVSRLNFQSCLCFQSLQNYKMLSCYLRFWLNINKGENVRKILSHANTFCWERNKRSLRVKYRKLDVLINNKYWFS